MSNANRGNAYCTPRASHPCVFSLSTLGSLLLYFGCFNNHKRFIYSSLYSFFFALSFDSIFIIRKIVRITNRRSQKITATKARIQRKNDNAYCLSNMYPPAFWTLCGKRTFWFVCLADSQVTAQCPQQRYPPPLFFGGIYATLLHEERLDVKAKRKVLSLVRVFDTGLCAVRS